MLDAPYFTVVEARALKPLNDQAKYPEADIEQERLGAEEDLEDACGQAFVVRAREETIRPGAYSKVYLERPRVRAITSVVADGTPYTAAEVAALDFSGYAVYLTRRHRKVVIGYEHGWDSLPNRAKRAALILTRVRLTKGPIDERATQIAAGAEGGTINLSTPGVFGATFGIPEVDAFVQDFGHHPVFLA